MSPPNQGRSPVFRGPMKAVAAGNHVFIKNGDGKEELFNVDTDPRQLDDLYSASTTTDPRSVPDRPRPDPSGAGCDLGSIARLVSVPPGKLDSRHRPHSAMLCDSGRGKPGSPPRLTIAA